MRLRKILEQCEREHQETRKEVKLLDQEIQKIGYFSDEKPRGWVPNNGINYKYFKEKLDKQGVIDKLDFEPDNEAVARWLFEFYGIKQEEIPYLIRIKDDTNNKIYGKYLAYDVERSLSSIMTRKNDPEDEHIPGSTFISEEASEKINELKALGHDVSFYDSEIDNKFKEYLNRLREQSNLI